MSVTGRGDKQQQVDVLPSGITVDAGDEGEKDSASVEIEVELDEAPGKSTPAPKKVNSTTKAIARTREVDPKDGALEQYLAEISKFDVFSREEEQEVARRWVDDGDTDAARQLVTANLRFVVKVAYEYRNYDVKLIDLIQEGNIGLMKAVQKFNPDRGYRLISYAVWWIRAYMQNYIINNWSMVKIGTTARHRKMLFGSRAAREELAKERGEETVLVGPLSLLAHSGNPPAKTDIARRDFSLDAALDEDGRTSYLEMLRDHTDDAESTLGRKQTQEIVTNAIEAALSSLNERERFILDYRILSDEPLTLQELGDHFGVTRERARQLESNLRKKLAKSLSSFDLQPADLSTDL